MNVQIKEHQFGPGETIGGILRKYNRHDMNKDSLDYMYALYNVYNGSRVPRLGDLCKIPVMPDGWKA